MNVTGPDYASYPRTPCYKCDLTRHNMIFCPEIDMLINRRVIHQDDTDQLC